MKVYFDYTTLGGEGLNKYKRVCATAKSARMVTDEYVSQRENAEKLIANKETDRSLSSLIKKEVRDEKAVITAIDRIRSGEYRILSEEEVSERTEAKANTTAQESSENTSAD
ncbi:MAG: hypothetical protein PUB34_02930 [Clostridia bacterium]|nr:hypothetical protein [Clostridia bacterium]